MSTQTERVHPLLEAIADLREDLDRLIDEQKALVLRCGPEPTAAATGAEAPATSRPWPVATPRAPIAEPGEPQPAEPARPEDARQRLNALAAKLLDRRQRQAPADTPTRNGVG